MSHEPTEAGSKLTRRVVLRGAALGGVALPLLAACGSGGGTSGAAPGPSDPTSDPTGSTGSSGGAAPLLSTSEVPVGGGRILADQQIVVTQASEGDFRAFTAICTHQGCVVSSVAGGTINCGCHGSQFSITDGSNVTGPSGSAAGSVAPLAQVKIKVKGAEITRV